MDEHSNDLEFLGIPLDACRLALLVRRNSIPIPMANGQHIFHGLLALLSVARASHRGRHLRPPHDSAPALQSVQTLHSVYFALYLVIRTLAKTRAWRGLPIPLSVTRDVGERKAWEKESIGLY
jgi:hypothetical protein